MHVALSATISPVSNKNDAYILKECLILCSQQIHHKQLYSHCVFVCLHVRSQHDLLHKLAQVYVMRGCIPNRVAMTMTLRHIAPGAFH
jgi:hypothetical protein